MEVSRNHCLKNNDIHRHSHLYLPGAEHVVLFRSRFCIRIAWFVTSLINQTQITFTKYPQKSSDTNIPSFGRKDPYRFFLVIQKKTRTNSKGIVSVSLRLQYKWRNSNPTQFNWFINKIPRFRLNYCLYNLLFSTYPFTFLGYTTIRI